MTSYLSKLEPSGRSHCLCGSGARFKNCCKNEYSKKHFDGWSLFNKGEYKKALNAIRSHITWYRLCHFAHTVPFLKSNSEESKKLLKTDIEALSDMTGLLLSCYGKCNILDEFPLALDSLNAAIDDERWKIKIDYHKCIYLYVYKNDKEAAIALLNNYEWKNVDDVDLLTVFLDVNSDSLNQMELISISEKICEITNSPSIKLQYGNMIGTEYCLLNDFEKGIPILEKTIADYELTTKEERTCIGRHHLAISYKHLGEITHNNDYIVKAVEHLNLELECGKYSKIGEAQLWFDMAHCFYHQGELSKALNSYEKSINLRYSDLAQVFKSRVLIELNDVDEARNILSCVDLGLLTYPNYFDFSISKCYLAIKSKESSDIDDALELITNIKTNDPLFKDVVQGFIVELYEIKNSTMEVGKAESALMKLNRYISLKPNLFGLGIDINAIIEDIGNRPSNKSN